MRGRFAVRECLYKLTDKNRSLSIKLIIKIHGLHLEMLL